MVKSRQIQGFYDDKSDVDAPDEFDSLVQRFKIRQLSYFDAFPVRLAIDSGATGNIVRASCASRLGAEITASSQSAHQA